MKKYIQLIKAYSKDNYTKIKREACGVLSYPFIVPGKAYHKELWDWDSWLTDIAIRQIMEDNNSDDEEFLEYEKGCILNFLEHTDSCGRMPFVINADRGVLWMNDDSNMHKPCLLQHIAFIIQQSNSDAGWILPFFNQLEKFIENYCINQKHKETGLFFWMDDLAVGVDNDPSVFYKPQKSCASIYLNCLMYKEFCAMDYVCKRININTDKYEKAAKELKAAINEHLWDERNGFYYSADLNLRPIDKNSWLHKGMPRHWNHVIQKIDVWCGFMCLWAEIAPPERAERMINENLLNEKTFYANYGIRSVSKCEKMYRVVASSNPSCWTGPIWIITNYLCFRGLIKYGYENIAEEIVKRTIVLLGKDIEQYGEMHEYYCPDTGKGLHNVGFQSWNLLVNNMIAWLENRKVIYEF